MHMARSLAIITVMSGRHMEPGGGSERAGDAWSLSRAHQQKRAETAALSTVHTIKDLEQGSEGGEVPNPLHLKCLKLFLYFGHTEFSDAFLCGNAAQLWKYRAQKST